MKQLILDTNVFVRFFIKDVESQYKQARLIFEKIEKEEIKGLISILVINEIVWILENYYELKREVYIPKLLNLLALKNIKIIEIDKDLLVKILEGTLTKKIDFTDLYLLQIKDTGKIFSFDKD